MIRSAPGSHAERSDLRRSGSRWREILGPEPSAKDLADASEDFDSATDQNTKTHKAMAITA